MRPRGHLATPKASPEDEILWIPTSLARHIGYSLPQSPDRAVAADETGAGHRRLPVAESEAAGRCGRLPADTVASSRYIL